MLKNKLYGGELAKIGSIIVRQRGTKIMPGLNVGVGKDHTLFALKEAGIDNCVWSGEGENEKFWYKDGDHNLDILVKVNPKFYRPADVELLIGDSTLARKELGWVPKVSFKELVKIMVKSDIFDIS